MPQPAVEYEEHLEGDLGQKTLEIHGTGWPCCTNSAYSCVIVPTRQNVVDTSPQDLRFCFN